MAFDDVIFEVAAMTDAKQYRNKHCVWAMKMSDPHGAGFDLTLSNGVRLQGESGDWIVWDSLASAHVIPRWTFEMSYERADGHD